jgi:ribonuclease HI
LANKTASGYVIISDGGSDQGGCAASACIILSPLSSRTVKLSALLGDATDDEAELLGGLLGFSAVRFLSKAKSSERVHVRWCCDRQSILATASRILGTPALTDRSDHSTIEVKNRWLWYAFCLLTESWEINTQWVSRRSKDRRQVACDRACRWVKEKGQRFLNESGEGAIGRIRYYAGEHAWLLLDARELLVELRKEGSSQTALGLLTNKLQRLLT